jgi:hypothetical protein
MNIIKIITGVYFLAAFFLQCQTAPNTTMDDTDFHPLNIGNYWNYNFIGNNKMTVKVTDDHTLIKIREVGQ